MARSSRREQETCSAFQAATTAGCWVTKSRPRCAFWAWIAMHAMSVRPASSPMARPRGRPASTTYLSPPRPGAGGSWALLARPQLHILQKQVPPGTSEQFPPGRRHRPVLLLPRRHGGRSTRPDRRHGRGELPWGVAVGPPSSGRAGRRNPRSVEVAHGSECGCCSPAFG